MWRRDSFEKSRSNTIVVVRSNETFSRFITISHRKPIEILSEMSGKRWKEDRGTIIWPNETTLGMKPRAHWTRSVTYNSGFRRVGSFAHCWSLRTDAHKLWHVAVRRRDGQFTVQVKTDVWQVTSWRKWHQSVVFFRSVRQTFVPVVYSGPQQNATGRNVFKLARPLPISHADNVRPWSLGAGSATLHVARIAAECTKWWKRCLGTVATVHTRDTTAFSRESD